MNDDLVRFARSFPTEANLQEAIAELLRKMPNTSGVHITQGTGELGKDIVFYSQGPLQERQLFACVIKNVAITGDVSAPSGATTVLNQAVQSLQNPYHSPSGDFHSVAHVYVISPHEISMSAMHSIEGGLDARSGQVTFICGGRLMELFQKHWAEYLIFESGALGTYVAQLLNDLERDDPVAALASRNSMLANVPRLKSVYVKQHFSVELRRFSSSAAVPEPDILDKPHSLPQIEHLKQALVSAATLMGIGQVVDGVIESDRASICAGVLLQLAVGLNERWTKAYLEYERTTPVTEVQPRNVAMVRVSWDSVEWGHISEELLLADTVLKSFDKRVADSNKFVTDVKNLDATMLHKPEFLNYCGVREVAKLAPRVLKTVGSPAVSLFPSTLIQSETGSFLITGSAGYGKTSFCKWHASDDASRFADKKGSILPLYVRLYQLANRQLGTFEEEFFPTTELRQLAWDKTDASARRIQKIRLYLDGLDEVSRSDRQREIIALARSAIAADSRIDVTLTARDYVSGQWLDWMPRVYISEFTETQTRELVAKLLDSNEEKIQEFFTQLQKTSGLSALMRIPLLATLIVSVFKKEQTSSLPGNRLKLYDIFVDLMCGGWDIVKSVRRDTHFGSADKIAVLRALAGRMHLNGSRECSAHEFSLAVKDSAKGFDPKPTHLLDEILQDGLLTKTGHAYMFAHLSFQEYLAAADLRDPTGESPKRVLRDFLKGNDWWAEVLSFYLGMLGRPEGAMKWMHTNFEHLASSGTLAEDAKSRYEFLLERIREFYPGYKIPDQYAASSS